jgi:hypothetical protein
LLLFRRKGAPLPGPTELAPCQVRSNTESPCPRRAVVEVRGVAFCGPCAREQEAYFAIGELVAQEEAQGVHRMPLAEALKRLRRERGAGSVAVGRPELPDVGEAKRLELTIS